MKNPLFILAVDGGATKTTITIRSEEGKCFFEKSGSASNYHIYGKNSVIEVLNSLLMDAYSSTKIQEIQVAVFAMAGIDTENDFKLVKEIINICLKQTPIHINHVIIENDVKSTLLGLIGGNPGGLLISGTGSIAYGSNGKCLVTRAGGWGHNVSDDGSGYWIGRQILKTIFRAEEGLIEKPTLLKKLVFEKLKINNIEDLFTCIHHPTFTNAQMASISSVLQSAVQQGDESAIVIKNLAVEELFLLIKSVLNKINYDNSTFPFYLNGGVLQHTPCITNELIQVTNHTYPALNLTICSEKPIELIVKRGLQNIIN